MQASLDREASASREIADTRIGDAFSRAGKYDNHALLQKIVAKNLADSVLGLSLPRPATVLEIGCGTGLLGSVLLDRLSYSHWTMTDISSEMVERARTRFADRPKISFATCDGEAPGAMDQFDLICSSLAFQWFSDLAEACARLKGHLSSDGYLVFTTLAAGSLREWQQAHGDLTAGLHNYPSAEELSRLGLMVEISEVPLRHADARSFLRSIKGIGAHTPRAGHRPLSAGNIRRVMERFEDAGCTSTYVVATCMARQR